VSSRPELSAVATSLDELSQRIARLADELSGAERDELHTGLAEVERSVDAARRRLGRLLSGRG